MKTPEANIIKLPNISASIPQLTAAIAELRDQGYMVPMFPADAKTDEENIKAKYAKVLGSAVNPVLREGNSDRRVAKPVKDYAKAHPHSMGAWDSNSSKTEVSSMSDGDFYSSEKSHVMPKADTVRIVLETAEGDSKILKEGISLQKDEIIDASRMSVKSLESISK